MSIFSSLLRYAALACLLPTVLQAELCYHGVAFGPTSYYLKRKRAGGSQQDGALIGLYANYERLVPWRLYWGADIYRSYGKLSGHTGSGIRLKSDFYEWESEARIGYTLPLTFCKPQLLTPFAGAGYFQNDNVFRTPSPLIVTFTNKFTFATVGILWTIAWDDKWTLGLRFRTQYAFDAKNQVTRDPATGIINAFIDDRPQYSIDIPIHYQSCHTHLIITPFYHRRHLGGRENFPFDFIDTKFYAYGARLHLVVTF